MPAALETVAPGPAACSTPPADKSGYTWCERSDIDPETLAGFKELLRVNDAVFARSLKEIGCYDGPIGPATIELLHDDPIFEAPRRHSPREKAIQQEKCSELRDAGIIVPSTSGRYALNSTMPAKKVAEGNWTDARYCCDASPLNNATKPDKYRTPVPEELFDKIGTAPGSPSATAERRST
ncbi:hypothetical protein TSOC_012880 [Tetrabaena socialis]|uniref:Uncharacterized protein n=1 Tax=Tetrabaena socialis TaxID=47790 RepID=A0A2J7ZLV5_9CHLO|nr:hypothetical protein TSOC_012880 [Tetrabaena socialis]|eukprot:PNH01247.1 hypothetical protein TSOC_012880 [Tetrabaena socialis]